MRAMSGKNHTYYRNTFSNAIGRDLADHCAKDWQQTVFSEFQEYKSSNDFSAQKLLATLYNICSQLQFRLYLDTSPKTQKAQELHRIFSGLGPGQSI
ncbi:MAG: hypothetical protein ACI8P9_002627 [Parasphingorhabdus sp.]|jgi:hypothetical protein